MQIRKFQDYDIDQIVTLFYETVHTVNKKDYSQEQLDAWASKAEEPQRRESWRKSLGSHISYVAERDGRIVGFTDMTTEGYLDRLFVHKDYQGQGIAAALVDTLESEAVTLGLAEVETEASVTAKPFFEAKGYKVMQPQIVERKGISLKNYRMKKLLNTPD
ncbi:GNAT family N-acetyltransferase [Paenibacillus tuaregi]|uniref:GNAT family N-acetyltransferase n=1 Tax=Paenibacillus tuaregi TaxID=1816681 RepID=UPI000839B015|nr:GNAT family N-acetyltransferase [Paenibacillus tuaregi]